MDIENFIIENQAFIYSITNYFKNYSSREDLFQAGCLGLIKAYKKFDSSMNVKFTTYAYPYILGEMKKLVREDKGIKVSREISKLNLKIEKAYVLLSQKLMKEPSITEISNFLDIPEYYVSEALLSLNKIKSIDEAVNDDGRELTLQEVIGKSDNVDDLIMLRDCLKSLSSEERELINNRYVNDYTQTEISKLIGSSQVQVSRKEQKIYEKMREKMIA